MKNYNRNWIACIAIVTIITFSSCGSDRTTGNEAAAYAKGTESDSVDQDRPDTAVTGIPGNTNAVNSAGNAGNGSGMGTSSNTEAEKKQPQK